MHQCPIFFRFDTPGALDVIDGALAAWFDDLGLPLPDPGVRIPLDGAEPEQPGGPDEGPYAARVTRFERGSGRRTGSVVLHSPGDGARAPAVPGPRPGVVPGPASHQVPGDEGAPAGPRTTTVSYCLDQSGARGWVLVCGHTAAPPARAPRPAAALASALRGLDGSTPLTAGAPIAQVPAVAGLLDAVRDPGRTRPLLVMGTDHGFPVRRLADLVASVVADAEGLIHTHVLDAPATARFNESVPAPLRIGPGTGRVFPPAASSAGPAPDPGPDDDGFPQRHTAIGADRLVSDEYGLRRELWHLALRCARDVTLPPGVERTVAELRTLAADCRTPAPETPPPGRPHPGPVPKPGAHMPHADALPRTRGGGVPGGPLGVLLGDILEDVLGERTIDTDALESLRVVARRGNRRTREHRRDRDEIRRLRHELAAARRTIDELRGTRPSAGTAHSGHGDGAGTGDDGEGTSERGGDPCTFAELIERLDALPRVRFTGDPQPALRLDRQSNARGFARKAWRALLALSDYAGCRAAGTGPPGVHNYLNRTPAGCRGFSLHEHAAVESDTTTRAAHYREPRVLPVPESVHPDGAVFMGGHFRLSTGGTVSPRLHYHDDTGGTGIVYVGYIGPHLPNQSAN